MRKIHVAVFRPLQPATFEHIEDKLETLQKLVGGYIEMLRINNDGLVLICNEEGKLEGLPFNRGITRQPIPELEPGLTRWVDRLCGTFFVCRTSDSDAEMHSIEESDKPELSKWGPFEFWDITDSKVYIKHLKEST